MGRQRQAFTAQKALTAAGLRRLHPRGSAVLLDTITEAAQDHLGHAHAAQMAARRPSLESLKSLLLLFTFLWAVYTFVWKEYLAPSLQEPKLDITSSINTTGPANSGLVRLSIKAKNTGLFTIAVLQDNWALYKLVRTSPGTEKEFLKRLDSFLEEGNENASIERASMIKPGAILATGSLELRALKSGESASFTKLVKLPQGTKEIYLNITIPYSQHTTTSDGALALRWRYDRLDGLIKPEVCMTGRASSIPKKPICYSHKSQLFDQWRTDNKIHTAWYNESFAVL